MTVSKDKVVKIHYTLKDDQGATIDTSCGKEPLEYIHGNGYLIPKLEEFIEGKNEGEKIHADISAADGYGEYNKNLLVDVDRENFDVDFPIEVGMQFQAMTQHGPALVRVVEVGEKSVKVDANHELAGENLHFDVEIVSIRDASAEELEKGLGGGCSCGGCGGECSGDCGENCNGDCGGECGGDCGGECSCKN